MNRIQLLNNMDRLLHQCKTCVRPPADHKIKCRGCSIYEELQTLGKNLGRKKDMARKAVVKITAEEYQDLKALGLNDTEIAVRKDMTPIALRNWKYANKIKRERVSKPKEISTPKIKTPREDKTVEMRQLINDLSDSNKTKDQMIKNLEATLETEKQNHQFTHAAFDDVESEFSSLRDEIEILRASKDSIQQEYDRVQKELETKDYDLENLRNKQARIYTFLKKLERENKALKKLVRIWI